MDLFGDNLFIRDLYTSIQSRILRRGASYMSGTVYFVTYIITVADEYGETLYIMNENIIFYKNSKSSIFGFTKHSHKGLETKEVYVYIQI